MTAVAAQLRRFFGKRGTAVVDANLAVIEAAHDAVVDVTDAVAAVDRHLPAPTLEEAIR
jgi:hypothetical protein